jgi:hypothetical protein
MSPAGFEPTIPANEQPQTHALDHAVTGIHLNYYRLILAGTFLVSNNTLYTLRISSVLLFVEVNNKWILHQ